MERTHAMVTCLVVAMATACTAITGADDLRVDRCANDVCSESSSTTPAESSGSTGTKPPSTNGTNNNPSGDQGSSTGGGAQTLGAVVCGLTTCGGQTPKCCARTTGESTCIAADGACDDGVVLGCSAADSCAKGTACCLVNDSGKPHGECRAASACTLPSVVLCKSNDECANGKCTGEIAGLDEYGVCSLY